MVAKWIRGIATLTLCLAIGGHWFCLQSIAWANMLASYSQSCSLPEAVAKTFDGGHPCDLCKQISKARSQEKRQETRTVGARTDLVCHIERVLIWPHSIAFEYPHANYRARLVFCETPDPPPRRQLV